MANTEATIRAKVEGLNEAIAKVDELISKIKEASTLAGELASTMDALSIEATS